MLIFVVLLLIFASPEARLIDYIGRDSDLWTPQDDVYLHDALDSSLSMFDIIAHSHRTPQNMANRLRQIERECHDIYQEICSDIRQMHAKLTDKLSEYDAEFSGQIPSIFTQAQQNALGRIFEDLEYFRLMKKISENDLKDIPELELFMYTWADNQQ